MLQGMMNLASENVNSVIEVVVVVAAAAIVVVKSESKNAR
jgi:intracellular sulfur oxidation DsrE/DsrF family protein